MLTSGCSPNQDAKGCCTTPKCQSSGSQAICSRARRRGVRHGRCHLRRRRRWSKPGGVWSARRGWSDVATIAVHTAHRTPPLGRPPAVTCGQSRTGATPTPAFRVHVFHRNCEGTHRSSSTPLCGPAGGLAGTGPEETPKETAQVPSSHTVVDGLSAGEAGGLSAEVALPIDLKDGGITAEQAEDNGGVSADEPASTGSVTASRPVPTGGCTPPVEREPADMHPMVTVASES